MVASGIISSPSDSNATERDPFECFTYLTVEKTGLYRAVMEVFSDAKAEFRLHLRPGDVLQRLRERGLSIGVDEEVEAALDALVRWGNLQSYHDTAEVNTIADFHRRRMLYQLTAAGEAASQAAAAFLEALDRPVALEATALARLRDYLAELVQLADEPSLDSGKILTILRSISTDAEHLTGHAQSFFRWLHEQTETQRADLDAFLQYKERLIDYLRKFLAELTERTGVIALHIEQLSPKIERLLEIAASHEAEAAFAKDDTDRLAVVAAAQRRWQHRWRGLRHWFVGVGGRPQVAQLRLAASDAIPRLLTLAAQLHDRRATRSDRRADWAELAAWFLEAPDDRHAHRLWRAAFGTCPARHLRVNRATLDEADHRKTPAGASWLETPPVYISPQLRQTGRAPSAAPSRRIIDRSRELVELRRRLMAESQQRDADRRSLVELGSRRLSEVGHLEHEALLLLLELLDRAALPVAERTQHATATSDDGSLRIRVDLDVPPRVATIETPAGHLHLSDALVAVTWCAPANGDSR
jgi:uncharacterized protein (TIGR02677 family)